MKRFITTFVLMYAAVVFAGSLEKTVYFERGKLSFKKEKGYDVIQIAGCSYEYKVGYPQIPVHSSVYVIPPGAEIEKVEVISSERVKIPGKFNILPVQTARPFMQHEPPPFVEPLKEVYESPELYPSNVILCPHLGEKGGYNLATITVFPIQYIPLKGEIYLFTEITFRIYYREGAKPINEVTPNRFDISTKIVEDLVVNKEDILLFTPPVSKDLPDDFVEYVVIIDTTVNPSMDLWGAFKPFVSWKTKKGVPAKRVALDWILDNYGGFPVRPTTAIRNFIKDAAQNWGIQWVLLVGEDDDDVDPSHGWGTPESDVGDWMPRKDIEILHDPAPDFSDEDTIGADLWYSDFNDDQYMDVYVGRVLFDEADKAYEACTLFVHNTLIYEKNPPSGYVEKMMLTSEALWGSYYGSFVSDSIAKYDPTSFFDAKCYEETGQYPGVDAVYDSLNSGYGWLHIAQHGNFSQAGDFSNGNLDNLATGDNLFILYSITCLAGGYDYESFAENLMTLSNHGAVACMLNYRSGWGKLPQRGRSEWQSIWFTKAWASEEYYNLGTARDRMNSQCVPYVSTDNVAKHCMYSYNLYGDPELPIWTAEPQQLVATHYPIISHGSWSFSANVTDGINPVENARVCLWCKKDNDMWGRGYTDAMGKVTLSISPDSVPDTMWVTVTKPNYKPVESYALIVSDMQMTVEPDTIDVEIHNEIIVTVKDSLGINPEDSVEINIYRYGVSVCDTTNSAGVCTLGVKSPYGQLLWVKGRKTSEPWNSFTDTIWVLGSDLSGVLINAKSDTIGVTDGLMPEIPGDVYSQVQLGGYTFYLEGCGIDTSVYTSSSLADIAVTPTNIGEIIGTVGKEGYNIYQDSIPVNIYKGLLSGYVINSFTGDSMGNRTIKGYEAGSDTSSTEPVFVTESSGGFPSSLPYGAYKTDTMFCGFYDIYTSRFFGHKPTAEPLTIKLGDNVHNILIDPEDSVTVSGTVKESISDDPLTSLIRIYRTDNGSLYRTITTDSLAGGTYSVRLPQFRYRFSVYSFQHAKIDTTLTLSTPSHELNFVMDTTGHSILVIDDSAGSRGGSTEGKGVMKKEGASSRADASVNKFYSWLTEFGYYVDTVARKATDPLDWEFYDFLVYTSGGFKWCLDSSMAANLMDWVDGGGKLLIEGGEIGCRAMIKGSKFGAFPSNVLNIRGWHGDIGGILHKEDTHPLTTIPNVLDDILPISSSKSNQDIVVPDIDAHLIYRTHNSPDNAGILIYEPTPLKGQIVYYAFNLDVLFMGERAKDLVENTAHYLLFSESGEPVDTLFGNVNEPTGEGTIVTARSSGYLRIDTTDASGNYQIPNLYDGTYVIMVSRDGYLDSIVTDVNITGTHQMDFTLYPLEIVYFEDFESDNGGYSSSSFGDWEWGSPNLFTGPPAHSGLKVWGTKLDGEYTDDNGSALVTTTIDLTGLTHPVLSFYHWYRTEPFFDGGNVKISANGGSYELLDYFEPPYNLQIADNNPYIPEELGYSGKRQGYWEEIRRDLSAYAGDTIKLRFSFGADPNGNDLGWYIDDVSIYNVVYSGVTTEEIPAVYSMQIPGIATGNQFSIIYGLPKKGRVTFKIYDCAGRQIKYTSENKEAGRYSMRIDMSGSPSGIYFIRMEAGDNRITRKMSFIK